MWRKQINILVLLVAMASTSYAQSPPACGTNATSLEAIRSRLLLNKAQLSEGALPAARSIEYVPVRFHMVTQNDGSGGVAIRNVLDQLCTLNEDFAETGIQFYMRGDFTPVRNTGVNENHIQQTSYMSMMRDAEAINVWIVRTPYSPNPEALTYGLYQVSQDWLIIRREEINRSSYTLTHEMGHFFGLLHTFYGWDIDPWMESRHGNPAPAMSPMDIPTERQDRSNCDSAGDYICDTPPDYNFGYYWTHNCSYQGGAKDPMGNLVQPDETNFMSYFDRCDRADYHFSPQQRSLMYADLMSGSRRYIRWGYQPTQPFLGNAQLESPLPGETLPFYDEIQLRWAAAEGATRYLLEIDRVPSFALQPQIYVLSQNEFTLQELDPNRLYYWRVRPFNEYHTCAPMTPYRSFRTGSFTTTARDIRQLRDWKVFPNPVPRNSDCEIAFSISESMEATVQLYTITGQIRHAEAPRQFQTGAHRITIPTNNLEPGVYLLTLQTQTGKRIEKIIIY